MFAYPSVNDVTTSSYSYLDVNNGGTATYGSTVVAFDIPHVSYHSSTTVEWVRSPPRTKAQVSRDKMADFLSTLSPASCRHSRPVRPPAPSALRHMVHRMRGFTRAGVRRPRYDVPSERI